MNKKEIIKKLIDDELEAIDGYTNAIKELSNDSVATELFKHIIEEEQEHIKELNELLGDKVIGMIF